MVLISRSTAATDSQSTIRRSVFSPFASSMVEKPASKTRSNLRNVDSSGWSKSSESDRPATAARSVCSITPNAESAESIGSKSVCWRNSAGADSASVGASMTSSVLPDSMPTISKSAAAPSQAGSIPRAMLRPSTRNRSAPRVASRSTAVSSTRALPRMREPRAASPLSLTVCRFVAVPPQMKFTSVRRRAHRVRARSLGRSPSRAQTPPLPPLHRRIRVAPRRASSRRR